MILSAPSHFSKQVLIRGRRENSVSEKEVCVCVCQAETLSQLKGRPIPSLKPAGIN